MKGVLKMSVHCRLCGYPSMTEILDLGYTPLADSFLSKAQLIEPEIYYPLRVVRCDECMLTQLSYVVDPEILYQHDYPYESSTTITGRMHFDNFAKSAIESFEVTKNDLAVDIGSNVGVLLKGFQNRGIRVVGVEPAENIALIAKKNGIPTINSFFSKEVAIQIVKEYGEAKIITATNVFAHIDDVSAMMDAVDTLLAQDGILIIEAPYLVHLLDHLEYDTIYHEHLSYFSVGPLVSFFHNCEFELFDIKQVDIHGGSNRIFISRKGMKEVSDKVIELIEKEKTNDIHSIENLTGFAKRVEQNKKDLLELLFDLKRQGKRIAGVSAPAKGMTLLNYCGIGNDILDFITEKSTLKIGKYTPGGHFLVLPDSALVSKNIDYALLLAWNFKDEIISNLSEFQDNGGKFIIPIPKPTII